MVKTKEVKTNIGVCICIGFCFVVVVALAGLYGHFLYQQMFK